MMTRKTSPRQPLPHRRGSMQAGLPMTRHTESVTCVCPNPRGKEKWKKVHHNKCLSFVIVPALENKSFAGCCSVRGGHEWNRGRLKSKMECLQVIEGLSEDLCTAALAHTSDSEADPQPDEDQLLNIYRIKQHVKQQLLELQRTLAAMFLPQKDTSQSPSDLYASTHRCAADAGAGWSGAQCDREGEESAPVVSQEDKFIETRNKELENEIEFAKVSHQNKTLTLQRIQLAHSVRRNLEENGEDSKPILDMLKSTLELCSSILSSKQHARELEDKLIQVRKERLMLKETGETMLSQIHSIAAKQKEELKGLENTEVKRLQGVLQEEVEMTTIAQNILQKLVIGSRVNWAEDRKLRDIVLNLEKNAASF